MKASKKISSKILASLAIISFISLVGCTQINISSNTESKANISKESNVVKTEYTGEELNKKYEAILPKVKDIYNDNGIRYGIYEDDVFNDEIMKEQFKDIKGIYLTESSLDKDISSTFFTISENLEGDRNIMFCGAINLNTDTEKDFNIEETFIKDITEVASSEFNSGKVDYSEINEFIKTSLKEERYKHENTTEVFDYGNVKITVTALPTVLYYININ